MRKKPEELLERGVRLALERGRPTAHVAADLRIHPETLRQRVRQAEADAGVRPALAAGRAARRRVDPESGQTGPLP
jgi:transposase-like protein